MEQEQEQKNKSTSDILSEFASSESSGGILLIIAAALAMIMANSAFSDLYQQILQVTMEVRVGNFGIDKPILLWINDGLMAVFFFLVGLELKRELIEGELSNRKNIILPGVGALGGMLVPAIIYIMINYKDPIAIDGWAIPTATDIAFALGILSLLGSRVPVSLKIFLTSLAIFDDVGAIIIIAIFYSAKLSFTALIIALCCIAVLFLLNRLKVSSASVYLAVGLVMWVATLKSGVHATLSGVVLAMFIPIKDYKNPDYSPLKTLEHDLHAVVMLFVIPIFAFANAGVNFAGQGFAQFFHSVPLGVTLGLFLGKQIGIMAFCWFFIKMGWASLPRGMNWNCLYGTSVLCGIGFTMSLFIGSLAFGEMAGQLPFDERLGIVLGSLLSGLVGYLFLYFCLPPNELKRKQLNAD